jgi:hypothetical protein
MKLRIALVVCLATAALYLALHLNGRRAKAPQALGQVQGPQIVLYTGENFTGRVINLETHLFDLPKDQEPDGSLFDWNDKVRSLIVVKGTWRLYQNGRLNTGLDSTPIENFDIQTKQAAEGWSALVSATSTGPLEIPDLSEGGIGEDLSSVELISETNLPDWALGFRKP